MEDMKVSPYKASEHFKHKYSARAIYKWKKKSGEILIFFSIPGIIISLLKFNSKIGVIAFIQFSEEILNSSAIKTFPL